MEIKLRGTALPCWAMKNIKAGKAVKLIPKTSMSSPDVVQGATTPDTDNDPEARFVAAFAVSNIKPPIYTSATDISLDEGNSTQRYTMREFKHGSENLPASVTVGMVDPRLKSPEQTIPSGTLMLAYDDGIYTVTSGCYTGTGFAVGDFLSVNAGGIWNESDTARVGIVWEYNGTKGELTIKTGR